VICSLLGQKAGAYLANDLLCRELARLGLSVTCFAQFVDFGGAQPPVDVGIVQPWMPNGCRWDWPGRCLAWQARRRIREERPDFVFVCGVVPLARHLLQSDVANQLLVWEFTNANPGNKFVDVEASRLLGRARAMLSPSATIDRNIRETYGYQGWILRLPFWIEEMENLKAESRNQKSHLPSSISDLPSPPADFIYLGRRDEEKGLRELVRATAAVARQFPNVRVLITGQGSEEPFLSLARDSGVSANVRFQFFRSREEAMQALANSRCLVLPSYHEGYPLVLLEAARASVPFIATEVGSTGELYRGTSAALMVPPRNADALAEAMNRILMEAPEQYSARRAAACAAFRRLSSSEVVQSQLRRVILALNSHPERQG